MLYLPKGAVVRFGGMPFELLEDVPTNGSEENYKLALSRDMEQRSTAESVALIFQAAQEAEIRLPGRSSEESVFPDAPRMPDAPAFAQTTDQKSAEPDPDLDASPGVPEKQP